MRNKKTVIPIIITLAIFTSLLGCTNVKSDAETSTATEAPTTQAATKSNSDMFTDRDYEGSYDENSAVKITLSDNKSSCESQNVTISDNTITIITEGTYILSGNLTNGQIIVDTDKTSKVQIVLNEVNINCNTSAAIYVKQANKVFITLASGTKNNLSNKNDFVAIDDNNIDSVIFSKDTLTLNGSGELAVNAAYGHGIAVKNSLKITSGTYTVEAAEHALQSQDSIRIAGGTINLIAVEDGIHSKNSDENNAEKGFVYIIGGTLNISADDDGIHADKNLTITDGMINIAKSNEGLEGESINISGGNITIKSSDDGINAASSSNENNAKTDNPSSLDDNCSINISGGTIKVNADGDGIDSNVNINISGGTIYVEGPTNDGNAALDYDGTATISGGIFIAIGSSGMAQNFSDSSTQGAMLVNISGSTGSNIILKDSSKNEILTYTANKNYSCAVISCPEITKGETYTVTSDNRDIEVTMSDTIYSSVENMMGGAPMGGGPHGGPMGNDDVGRNPMDKEKPNKPQ